MPLVLLRCLLLRLRHGSWVVGPVTLSRKRLSSSLRLGVRLQVFIYAARDAHIDARTVLSFFLCGRRRRCWLIRHLVGFFFGGGASRPTGCLCGRCCKNGEEDLEMLVGEDRRCMQSVPLPRHFACMVGQWRRGVQTQITRVHGLEELSPSFLCDEKGLRRQVHCFMPIERKSRLQALRR